MDRSEAFPASVFIWIWKSSFDQANHVFSFYRLSVVLGLLHVNQSDGRIASHPNAFSLWWQKTLKARSHENSHKHIIATLRGGTDIIAVQKII